MRARPAQVETADRRPVVGPASHRPQEQQLIGGHVAVQGVTARQPHQPFHVERGDDLPVLDQVGQLREVLGDRRDRPVGAVLLDVVPLGVAQRVRLGVHVDRHDVLALGRERRIVHGREAHLDVRGIGGDALDGLGLLGVHVRDEGVQLHDAGVVGLHAVGRADPSRTAARSAPGSILMLVPMQRYASMRATNSSGRSARSHSERNVRFGSALESTRVARRSPRRSARRTPTARPPRLSDPVDLGVAPDLAPGLAGGVGHRGRQHAHAAAHEPPLAHAALGFLARMVVQQHVGGARGRRSGHAVVDRVPAERGLHVLALEPFGQELVRARREQVREVGQALALPQPDAAPFRQRAEIRQRADPRVRRRPVERGKHRLDELGEILLERRQARERPRPRTGASPRRWPPCRHRGSSRRRRRTG